MSINTCRFCEHSNPEGAKFCTECGGCLHLLPCPSCGAVTDVTASTCYQCQAQLPWHNATALEAVPATAEVAKPKTRWQVPAIAGAAVLAAVVAGLGYYGYRQRLPTEAPPAAGASSPRNPVGEAPPAVKAVAVPVPAEQADKADVAGPRAPAAVAPCTAAEAAVGACAPQSVQKPGAEAGAAIVDARPQAAPGKGNETAPPRPDGCEAAVAALGLCTAAPVQTPAVTHTQRSE